MSAATCPHCGSEMTIRFRILTELRTHGPTSPATLAGRLGISDESCRRTLLQMKKADLIVPAGRKRNPVRGPGAVLWGVK